MGGKWGQREDGAPRKICPGLRRKREPLPEDQVPIRLVRVRSTKVCGVLVGLGEGCVISRLWNDVRGVQCLRVCVA